MEDILVPSNKSWRLKNYLRLVAKQREVRNPTEIPSCEPTQPEAKKRRQSSSIVLDSDFSLISSGAVESSWSPADLCKAAQILDDPEARRNFQDDEEMHRVYCLLYDVFRYKTILGHVLHDIGFFLCYPQFEGSKSLVWLLFYDLYKRKFLPREPSKEHDSSSILLKEEKIFSIEQSLWDQRVRMAASIARLRIKNNALKLSQLLPHHLRDERMFALEDAPLSGWVNTYKTTVDDITQAVEKGGLKFSVDHTDMLDWISYRWDHTCPNVLLCHNNRRGDLAQSPLVQSHYIVLQDRSFCFGPAVMATLLKELDLAGNVIQTHINSPRSTAYFATILATNEEINHLYAFGAGHRKKEYEKYLQVLGVRNITILEEQFIDMKIDSPYLIGACAILATPPNTYSAVLDPVDLVCSRGGDMSMLEALTDIECDDGAKKRVNAIVEQQQKTLHIAMSPPQIQIVLYETHSVASTENKDVVQQAIDSMNEMMREKYIEDLLSEDGICPSDEVVLPDCDLYEQGELPKLCECVDLNHEGCFLALIKRKEITRMDAKFMINIAETRGLFGSKVSKSASSSRAHKRRKEVRQASMSDINIRSRTRRKIEIERIMAPTRSSILRQISYHKMWVSGDFDFECPRYKYHENIVHSKVRQHNVRQWWFETVKYILSSMSETFKLTRIHQTSREVLPLSVKSIEFDSMSQSYKSI